MSARIEAAAKAVDEFWGGRYFDEAADELGGEMAVAIEASDAVLFSEEAIERAARALFIAENPEADWDALPLNQWVTDIYRKRTRTVLAALRGEA